jgi:SAM-dependent methyltransferase
VGSRLPDPALDGWPAFLAAIRAEERDWSIMWPRQADPGYVGFMPFNLARFVMFLTDAVSEAPGDRFLDVGCGPGTKVLLAAMLYDLDAAGIDILPMYISAARAHGVPATYMDAREFNGYADFDIVYLNRPVKGDGQAKLEAQIMNAMRPGAVLMLMNGVYHPGQQLGWEPVAEEWDTLDGVWRKPLEAQ